MTFGACIYLLYGFICFILNLKQVSFTLKIFNVRRNLPVKDTCTVYDSFQANLGNKNVNVQEKETLKSLYSTHLTRPEKHGGV